MISFVFFFSLEIRRMRRFARSLFIDILALMLDEHTCGHGTLADTKGGNA